MFEKYRNLRKGSHLTPLPLYSSIYPAYFIKYNNKRNEGITLKKMIYTANLFFICFAVILCTNTRTFAKTNYSHVTLLTPTKVHCYDLNGDGEKDTIQYLYGKNDSSINYTSYLFINGELIDDLFIGDICYTSQYYICDFNSKDKKLDLCRLLIGPDAFTIEEIIRYNPKLNKYEIIKFFDNHPFDWDTSKNPKNINHPESIRLNGENRIDIALERPFHIPSLGKYTAWIPMKIKNNQLVYDNVKTYEFASRGDTLTNKTQYTLNKNCTLYTSPKKTSTKKKTLKKGDKISVLKIIPHMPKKLSESGHARSAFIYVKDKTNTYGWIYIEKEGKQNNSNNKNNLFR